MKAHDALNILLVDDQPAKLLSYEVILQDLGENLIMATSAAEALECLLKNEIAVVLVDVCMPDLDGYELATMIREHPRHQKTSIIFVSAILLTDLDRIRGYECGGVDYVPVPVVPEILRAKVSVFTALYRTTQQLERLNRELEQRVARRTAALEVSAAELRRKEEHLRLALDAGRMGTWEWDRQTGAVTWDAAQHQLYGVRPEEHVGVDTFFSSVIAEDVDASKEAIERAFERGVPYKHEFRIQWPDGSVHWLASRGDVVFDSEQRPEKLIGVTFDITDHKKSEQALQEADRRKDEFIAVLAHELRNPLAPIRTAVELLGLKELPEAQRERSREIIGRQVDHLVRLIDDLLDVSRISQGLITLQLETIDFRAPIARAIETVQPEIDARRQELIVDLPNQAITVEADPMRLAQAIGNVLYNAAKFTAEGGRIVMRVMTEEATVSLTVKDTGVGITPEMLPRIFESFTRGDSGPPWAKKGLGIGLSLARRLMQMHGGSVTAYSEGAGLGSEFILSLPLSATQKRLDGHDTSPTAQPQATASRRILVVDDYPDAAESLSALLQLAGHDVCVAGDGLEAISKAEAFSPHVVLLDLGLPHLNGYDTARRLREQPWGRALRLVALSGWGAAENRQQTAEAGFDHHLVKPVDLAELFKVVADVVPSKDVRVPAARVTNAAT